MNYVVCISIYRYTLRICSNTIRYVQILLDNINWSWIPFVTLSNNIGHSNGLEWSDIIRWSGILMDTLGHSRTLSDTLVHSWTLLDTLGLTWTFMVSNTLRYSQTLSDILGHFQILDGLQWSDTLEWSGILADTIGYQQIHSRSLLNHFQLLLNFCPIPNVKCSLDRGGLSLQMKSDADFPAKSWTTSKL